MYQIYFQIHNSLKCPQPESKYDQQLMEEKGEKAGMLKTVYLLGSLQHLQVPELSVQDNSEEFPATW